MVKEKQGNKQKKHWWIFWVSLPLVLLFIASLIYLYVNAEKFLSATIQTTVHDRSNGIYSIEYTDIDLHVFRGSFNISDIRFIPDSTIAAEDHEEPLYYIGSESISVIGINLWQYIFNNKVVLKGLVFEKPSVEVAGSGNTQKQEQQDMDVILRKELGRYFNDLIIGEFRINHAVVEFPQNRATKILSGIGSISIILKDVKLNEETNADTSSFFLSDEAMIILHDLNYHLDSIGHDLLIEQVTVSADEELINLEHVLLQPSFPDSLLREYRINIPRISITQVNIDSIIKSGTLNAGELLIENPGIAVHLLKRKNEQTANLPTDSVLLILPEELWFIKVKSFFLRDGIFRFVKDHDSIEDFAEIKSFSFLVDSIKFDSIVNREQIADILLSGSSFAGKDVTVNLSILKHRIYADILNISPAEGQLISSGLLINAVDSTGSYLNGNIKALELHELDYKRLLSNENLFASIVIMDSADLAVNIQEPPVKKDHEPELGLPYFELDTVIVTGSSLSIDHKRKGKAPLYFSSDVEFTLAGFKPDTSLNSREQPIDLQLAVLSLKRILIRKNRNFSIAVGDLDFNSENRVLMANNFSQQFLSSKGNSPRLIELESLRMNGLMMSEFLENSNGNMKSLIIKNPEIYFDTLVAGPQKRPGEIQQEIAREILSFMQRLSIGHLDINNLGLHFGHNRPLSERTEIRDIFIDLTNLNIHARTIQERRPAFADQLKVEIRNFREFSSDGSAEITFNHLLLDRQANKLTVSGFSYMPVALTMQNQSGMKFKSNKIVFDPIDFDEYYFDKNLITGNLSVYSPEIIYKYSAPEQSSVKSASAFTYPSFADLIKVQDINLISGKFRFGNGADTALFDYDLHLSSLSVDTEKKFIPGKDPLPFKQFNIDIRDFSSSFSKSENTLNIDKLTYSTGTDELSATGIRLFPEMDDPLEFLLKNKRKMTASVDIPELFIDAFEFNELYLYKTIDLQMLETDQLDVKLYVRHVAGNEALSENNSYFPKFLRELNLDLFQVKDLDLKISRFAGDSVTTFSLNDISGRLNNFRIDENSRFADEIFNAGDLYLEKGNYSYRLADSMYILTADNISLSTGNGTLSFESFKLIPRYPRYEFSRKLGYQTDRAEVEGHKILLTGVDFKSFFENSRLFVDKLYLNDFSISLFRDKRVSFPAWHRSKMPQKMLRELSFPLDINKVELQDFRIRYSEMAKNAKNPGVVFFENMNGSLSNITNLPDSINLNPLMQLRLKGEMLNEGQMNVLLNMHLDSPRDTFSFYGSLSTMDLPVLNSLSRNLFGVAIKKGRGSVDTLMIFGNEEYETGYMIFPYKKFRIQMIDPSTGQRGGIGDGIMTFLANNILLKSNNPRVGHPVRVGRIFFKRNPRKSIVNFLWKGIMSGVETTLGYNIREQKKEIKAFKELIEDQQDD